MRTLVFAAILICVRAAAEEVVRTEICDDRGFCEEKVVIITNPEKELLPPPGEKKGRGKSLLFSPKMMAPAPDPEVVDVPNQRNHVRLSQIRQGACFVRAMPGDKLEFGRVIEYRPKERWIRMAWEFDNGKNTLYVKSNFWRSWGFRRDISPVSCSRSPNLWNVSYLKNCLGERVLEGKRLCAPEVRMGYSYRNR